VPAFAVAGAITFCEGFGAFSAATLGFAAFAFPVGLVAGAFFTAGLAAVLAAAGFVFFAGDVGVFAGLFIALAMESTNNLVALAARTNRARFPVTFPVTFRFANETHLTNEHFLRP
jgi:hypothetical protein